MVTLYRNPPVCDFCSAQPVTNSYEIADFQIPFVEGVLVPYFSTGGFAACADCAKLVDSNNKKALEDRSVESFIELYGSILTRKQLHDFVHRLHREFWSRLHLA
jgi:hypothetical protein